MSRALSALILLSALTMILGGVWKHGQLHERAVWEQRVTALEAERARQAARIEGQTEQLARLQADRERLIEELENEARTDPDADRGAIPLDSVRRLNSR